jgi:hypothetical protein
MRGLVTGGDAAAGGGGKLKMQGHFGGNVEIAMSCESISSSLRFGEKPPLGRLRHSEEVAGEDLV